MSLLLVICFWLALGLLTHAYVGYPVALWLLSRLASGYKPVRPAEDEGNLPAVSLLVAAHNEEEVMEAKMVNCAALDYPPAKMEVLLGSDASTDATVEAARLHGPPNLRIFDFPQRSGKGSVLNRLARAARGDILVFSDANAMYEPQALRRLVASFADSRVGCVSGRLRLVTPDVNPGGRGEGLYWRCQTALRKLESRLGTLIGAQGAIYAIRRDLFAPIPRGTVNDAFLLSAKVLEQGYRSLYEPQAEAVEQTAATLAGEYRRHLRDAAGHFQVLSLTWRLLNPLRGRVAFGFFSHRVIRWFAPLLLAAMLLASAILAGQTLYRSFFTVQVLAYSLSLLGYVGTRLRMKIGPLYVPLHMAMLHIALLVGLLRHLSGRRPPMWAPERVRGS